MAVGTAALVLWRAPGRVRCLLSARCVVWYRMFDVAGFQVLFVTAGAQARSAHAALTHTVGCSVARGILYTPLHIGHRPYATAV